MVVADAMVVIHLAKMTLLGTCCEYFKLVVIPQEVQREVLAGKAKGYGDATLVEELLHAKRLVVKLVRKKELLRRAREFNLQRGEAEAVALCWQEQADRLASDEDSVRRKAAVLGVELIGTPAILLTLYREQRIDREKFTESLAELRKIGWFSNAVIDKILLEAT